MHVFSGQDASISQTPPCSRAAQGPSFFRPIKRERGRKDRGRKSEFRRYKE